MCVDRGCSSDLPLISNVTNGMSLRLQLADCRLVTIPHFALLPPFIMFRDACSPRNLDATRMLLSSQRRL